MPADGLRGRWRLPMVRVQLFVLQYLVNDSVEIVLAPVYWVLAGFGRRLESARSVERHLRLVHWSLGLLEKRARQLLGLRLEFGEAAPEQLKPGPVIVTSRHTSVLDSSLPGLLCRRSGLRFRAVIMAELLADPGLDLIYGRLGSAFIPATAVSGPGPPSTPLPRGPARTLPCCCSPRDGSSPRRPGIGHWAGWPSAIGCGPSGWGALPGSDAPDHDERKAERC